jgi:YggT family protein
MTAQESNPALDVVCIVLTVFWVLLLVRVIVSWAFVFGFRPPLGGPLRKGLDLLDDVTDPVLRPLRRLIPPVRAGGMGVDLSILVAFVILLVLQQAFCT